jgi:hypothetical protein
VYQCQSCSKIVPAHIPSFQITVKTRFKSYPHRSEANWFKLTKADSLSRKSRWESRDDPGGSGAEIVKEIRVCPNCYQARKPPIQSKLPRKPPINPRPKRNSHHAFDQF